MDDEEEEGGGGGGDEAADETGFDIGFRSVFAGAAKMNVKPVDKDKRESNCEEEFAKGDDNYDNFFNLSGGNSEEGGRERSSEEFLGF